MQPWEILDKFTEHLRDVLARSIAVATEVGEPNVTPVHLLYSITLQKGSVAHDILGKADIDTETLAPHILAKPVRSGTPGTLPTTTIPELTPQAKGVLEKAMLIAADFEHAHVGTEHLLSAILSVEDKAVMAIFDDLNITTKRIANHTENILQSISRFPDIDDANELDQQPQEDQGEAQSAVTTKQSKKKKKKRTMLEYFATELTHPEIQEDIDPVIGRETEINRVIHILSRRSKNNPILLGEPGVGKTAIAEGLAKKIVAGDVPDILLSKKVWQLDIGLLIAGTIYRGEFESRIKQIVDEIAADPSVILFIDEIHTIVGTGSSQGSMDAANILKPALARGQIRCIGATTAAEYKKYIEADSALERRFQAVYVDEPSDQKTYQILKGVAPHYEKFHDVTISKPALKEAVSLSSRFIHNSKQPDKALDLIDEAAAAVRVRSAKDKKTRAIHSLHQKIQDVRSRKEAAVYEEHFDHALSLKKEEKDLMRTLNQTRGQPTKERLRKPRVTATDVARVVAQLSNMSLQHVLQRGHHLYNNLHTILGERVIGQSHAAQTLSSRLRIAAAGLTAENRPFASFLFVGPTGVGKTETAKELARALYPGRDGLLRIDMGEFSEGYGVSKLLGAPAGYIGYRESTPLLDKLKHQPHSVVLFDNVDKAHPDVMRVLLQVLEEGMVNSSEGKTISFKHAIVILTAAGEHRLFSGSGIGFNNAQDNSSESLSSPATQWLQETLGEELLGRVDSIVPFRSLTNEDLQTIINLHLGKLNSRLKKRQSTLTVSQEAIEHLLNSIKKEYGARNIRSLVARHVADPLTVELSKAPSDSFHAHLREGKIVIQ